MIDLSDVGPSWSAMTSAQRAAYGPAYERPAQTFTLDDVQTLLVMALQFRRTIVDDGLAAVAERWGYSESVIALGACLDGSNPVAARIVTHGIDQVADVADRKEVPLRVRETPLLRMRAESPRSLQLLK